MTRIKTIDPEEAKGLRKLMMKMTKRQMFNFSGRMEAASGLPLDEVPDEIRLPAAIPEK